MHARGGCSRPLEMQMQHRCDCRLRYHG